MKLLNSFPAEYYEFCLTEDGIYKILPNGTFIRISNYMEILSIIQDIDTDEYQAEIGYAAFNVNKRITILRKDYLQRKGLLNLQAKGLDITESNASSLVKYFGEEEKRKIANRKNTHSTLGFSEYNGKIIFKHHKAIGIESDYKGTYDIAPRGSYKKYMEMLKNEVFGNTLLETMVAASASSILLGYLGSDLNLESTIIHLVSDSTTGKSTTMKLIISLFGNPDSKTNSLMGSFNGTANALLQKLTGLNGISYALDELSMSSMQNFTTFIYALANGTEKERLNKESILMVKKSWITNIFSNGERSLVNSANKNKGIAARVIEVKNCTFTKDAKNAENIQRTIRHSYGHLGYKFAEYILTLDRDNLIARFEEIREMLFDKFTRNLKVDELLSRRTAKFAIIVLTAELLQTYLGIAMQMDGMYDFLMQIERDSLKSRNFNTSVIDYIKDYISINLSYFASDATYNKGCYGKIQEKRSTVEVSMNRTSFKKMLSEGKYEDPDIILKELKKTGYLSCEKDRYTRTRKSVLGVTDEFYVLMLEKGQITADYKHITNPEIPEEIIEVDII